MSGRAGVCGLASALAVGLTAFRILPNFTLATERGSRAVDTRG